MAQVTSRPRCPATPAEVSSADFPVGHQRGEARVIKIPTVFQRDIDSGLVFDAVNPKCEWVLRGEGVATRKWDGTCCLVRAGKLYKRHQISGDAIQPANFELVDFDPQSGKRFGWLPVGDGPEDRWHREAMREGLPNWTYELCGPKINGNPEALKEHRLILHGEVTLWVEDRSFSGIKKFLEECPPIEGIVFHGTGVLPAKIKRRDFGFPWPVKP